MAQESLKRVPDLERRVQHPGVMGGWRVEGEEEAVVPASRIEGDPR